MSKNQPKINTSLLKTNKIISSFLLQLLLTVSLAVPLTLGIGKLTHLFDGKDGEKEKDTPNNNPYIENPDPSTGEAPYLIVLNSIVSNFHPPTEADIHLVNSDRQKDTSDDKTVEYDNKGKYLEKPQDVWQGQHKDELWYLSEIWWPNNSDYDFLIKNYYFNALNFWFEKAKKELNITAYEFKMNGKLQSQSKQTNEGKTPKNSTNIDLNISDRSVYGLTINSFTFSLSIKVLDQEEQKTLTLKYPKPIEVKKEVFTDFANHTTKEEKDDGTTNPPHFQFSINTKNSFETKKEFKHSILDIQTDNRQYLNLFGDDKIENTNLEFLKHLNKFHSFNLIPSKSHDGVDIDYIFMFNFHDLQKNENKRYSRGFYLITQIHCNHDKNNGDPNPNREDGKWIR